MELNDLQQLDSLLKTFDCSQSFSRREQQALDVVMALVGLAVQSSVAETAERRAA